MSSSKHLSSILNNSSSQRTATTTTTNTNNDKNNSHFTNNSAGITSTDQLVLGGSGLESGSVIDFHRNELDPEIQRLTLRERIWLVMDDPSSSKLAYRVNTAISITIMASIVAFCLETLPELAGFAIFWLGFEIVIQIIFTVEFLTRLFTTPDLLQFAASANNWIDLLAILPFYLQILFGGLNSEGGLIGTGRGLARLLRLARVIRVFKLIKYSSGFLLVKKAMARSIEGLWVVAVTVSLVTVLLSSFMYFAELDTSEYNEEEGIHYLIGTDIPSSFQSIPGTFYWCITTMSTVGYGDNVPRTDEGKFIAAVAMVVGILTIGFPITLVGANFQDVYKEEKLKAQLEDSRRRLGEREASRLESSSHIYSSDHNDEHMLNDASTSDDEDDANLDDDERQRRRQQRVQRRLQQIRAGEGEPIDVDLASRVVAKGFSSTAPSNSVRFDLTITGPDGEEENIPTLTDKDETDGNEADAEDGGNTTGPNSPGMLSNESHDKMNEFRASKKVNLSDVESDDDDDDDDDDEQNRSRSRMQVKEDERDPDVVRRSSFEATTPTLTQPRIAPDSPAFARKLATALGESVGGGGGGGGGGSTAGSATEGSQNEQTIGSASKPMKKPKLNKSESAVTIPAIQRTISTDALSRLSTNVNGSTPRSLAGSSSKGSIGFLAPSASGHLSSGSLGKGAVIGRRPSTLAGDMISVRSTRSGRSMASTRSLSSRLSRASRRRRKKKEHGPASTSEVITEVRHHLQQGQMELEVLRQSMNTVVNKYEVQLASIESLLVELLEKDALEKKLEDQQRLQQDLLVAQREQTIATTDSPILK